MNLNQMLLPMYIFLNNIIWKTFYCTLRLILVAVLVAQYGEDCADFNVGYVICEPLINETSELIAVIGVL